MSNTLATVELIVTIIKYITYLNLIIIPFGIVGNGMNIFVLTKLKLFRNNQSSFYLIIESILNIFILFFSLISLLSFSLIGNDLSNMSLVWCKLVTTIGQPMRLLISSIICFEALHQFLSTHHQIYIRQLSTFRLARWLICVFAIIWTLQTIPYIIYYDIIPNYGCLIINPKLIEYYSYGYYILLDGLLPIFTSICFSLLAYRNVRRLVQLRLPIERRRFDRQMTAMIFTRVIAFIICLTPYTIYRIYSINHKVSLNDPVNYIVNQLIYFLVITLLLCIYTINFYIFLLTSSRYRHQTKHSTKKYVQLMIHCCRPKLNTIRPLGQPSHHTASDSI